MVMSPATQAIETIMAATLMFVRKYLMHICPTHVVSILQPYIQDQLTLW